MNVVEDLRTVVAALEASDTPYMVVGGLALDALGVPRMTVDVDIQVAMDPPPAHATSVLGLLVEEHARDPVFDQDAIVTRVPLSGIPVELFLTTHWLTRQALDRRQQVTSQLLDRPIPVPTPEDFLLLKSAYMTHPTRSERKAAQDGVDLEAVARIHAETLDRAYEETNARKLGTWGVLESLLAA